MSKLAARSPIRIDVATGEDQGAICALLSGYKLPTTDLEKTRPWFVVAREGADIVGAGALETCGSIGLVRSIAVHARLRGTGLGRALVERLENRARELRLAELVLLTETAKTFFEKLGYRVIDRQSAPKAVQDSEEFRSLCPQSAICLSKRLFDRGASVESA